MTDIKFNTQTYTVVDSLATEIQALYNEGIKLQAELERLRNLVTEWHLKEVTAKQHPTRDMKLAAYYAKQELLNAIPKQRIIQLELLHK